MWDAKMHRGFWPDGHADWIFMREIQEIQRNRMKSIFRLKKSKLILMNTNSVSLAVQVEGFWKGFRVSSQNSDVQVYQEIYNGPDTAYTKVDLWR